MATFRTRLFNDDMYWLPMMQKKTTIADSRRRVNIHTDRGVLKHVQSTLLQSAV